MITMRLHKLDALVGSVLVIIAWRYMRGLEHVLDIGLFDESNYLYAGYTLLDSGPPPPGAAPLYAGWYFLLSALQPDRIALYFLNYKVLSTLLPLTLYGVLRRYGSAILPSVLVSFLFLISFANLPLWPKVSHFALLVILAALALASCARSALRFSALITVGALLSAFVRPELFVAFILLALCYVALVVSGLRELRRSDLIEAAGVLALCGTLLAFLGMPLNGENRAFRAFGQHFAVSSARRGGSDSSPWTSWPEIVSERFGAVDGVAEAMLANPAAFAKHVAHNAAQTPKGLLGLFFGHANVLAPSSYYLVEAGLLLALLAIYLFWKRKTLKPRLSAGIASQKKPLLVVACFLVPVLVSVLVVFPRHHYLLQAGVLMIVMTAMAVGPGRTSRGDGLRVALLLAVLVAVAPPGTSAFAHMRIRDRRNVETVRFIESLRIREQVNLLEVEGGLHLYLGENYRSVPAYEIDAGFGEFLTANRINMVVLTDTLENDSRFEGDAGWKRFSNDHSERGFVELEIPRTEGRLLVDEKLLDR